MKAGFRSAEVQPETGRHLGQRHPQVVVEDDNRAAIRAEVPEGAIEEIAVDDVAAEVGDDRGVQRGQLDLSQPPLAAAGKIHAGVHEQPMEPGIEPVRVAQRWQVSPGSDHRLLDRVPCEVVVAEDQAGGRVQARDRPTGQRREGVMIASLCSLDETSLVHGRLGLRVAQPP